VEWGSDGLVCVCACMCGIGKNLMCMFGLVGGAGWLGLDPVERESRVQDGVLFEARHTHVGGGMLPLD
jgi:hypothetical protein